MDAFRVGDRLFALEARTDRLAVRRIDRGLAAVLCLTTRLTGRAAGEGRFLGAGARRVTRFAGLETRLDDRRVTRFAGLEPRLGDWRGGLDALLTELFTARRFTLLDVRLGDRPARLGPFRMIRYAPFTVRGKT